MNLNKGISIPTAILFIIICSAVVGIIVWQFTKSAEQPIPKSPSDYITQSACEEANYYWYDKNCYQEPQSETPTIKHCGIIDIGSISVSKDLEKYSTLVCLGESLLQNNNQKSKAVFKSPDKGDLKINIENNQQGETCNFKIKFGNEEQIQSEEYKRYANKSIKCPVFSLLKAAGKYSEDQKEEFLSKPADFAFQAFRVTLLSSLSSEGSLEYECSGGILEELKKETQEKFEEKQEHLQKNAKDNRIITAMSKSNVVMDEIYNSEQSYSSFDCTGEMKENCNMIANNSSNEKKPTIYTSSDAACYFTKLNREDDLWYCVDSNGATRRTKIDPETIGNCNGYTFTCPSTSKEYPYYQGGGSDSYTEVNTKDKLVKIDNKNIHIVNNTKIYCSHDYRECSLDKVCDEEICEHYQFALHVEYYLKEGKYYANKIYYTPQ